MTTRLPESKLAEIAERCEAATPGPWIWDDSDRAKERGRGDGDMVSARARPASRDEDGDLVCEEPIIQTDSGVYGPREHDRAFIAHARADIPALMEHVRALEAELATERSRQKVRPGHHPPCPAMLDSEAVCRCGQ